MSLAARSAARAVKKAGPAIYSGGVTKDGWVCGKPHQLKDIKEDSTDLQKNMATFLYKQQDYCKVGLLAHDLTAEDHIEKWSKARSRMTPEDLQDHYYRLNRGLLLSARKHILPPEEWTPIDAPHMYLNDIVAQIDKEEFEKSLMKCVLNDYDDNWDRIMLIPFRLWNFNAIRKQRDFLSEKLTESVI